MLRQIAMIVIARSAVFGSDSQFGPAMPNYPRIVLNTPVFWYMMRQTIATATMVVITGV